MYKRILMAYDGSPEYRRALRQGTELAEITNAEVHLLAVIRSSAAMPMAVVDTLRVKTCPKGSRYRGAVFTALPGDLHTKPSVMRWVRCSGTKADAITTSLEPVALRAKVCQVSSWAWVVLVSSKRAVVALARVHAQPLILADHPWSAPRCG